MPSGNGTDVLAKSVTADDYNDNPRTGSILHFMLPMVGGAPDLPAFWSYARDWTLYSTIYRESMWAAAVYIAITKQAAKSFEVESDIPKRQKDAQRLFLSFDNNRGWVGGISKHLMSYLLTGNGGPVEVVRATGAPGSKVLGLIPLDPFRTVRTGDPRIPFIYRDRMGREHELRDYEAFIIADTPDPMDLWYGVGHCAAERAYNAIIKLEGIERYIYEKVTGKRALALDFIAGVLPQQIEDAKRTATQESMAKGITTYLGSTIIPLAGDIAPVHVRVNLAELPDGFARKEEFDLSVLTYARSIGIPVQDLQPLSGQGLGTGTQSQVLEESAKGQGLATWNKSFGHAVNEYALDEKTTFYFRENDIRDREREAKVRIDEATAIATWVTIGLSQEQAFQLGRDRDQLPPEFVPQDQTMGDSLSDTEKPVDEADIEPVLAPESEPILAQDEPAPDAILKSARQIYQAISGREIATSVVTQDNPLLDRLLDIQERTLSLLVNQPRTKETGDLSESVRKAIEIAWTHINEPSFTALELADVRREIEKAASADDVATLRDTLESIRSGELGKTVTDIRAVQSALGELDRSQRARASAHARELGELKGELKALAEKEAVQVQSVDGEALATLATNAARSAAESVWDNAQFKHAEDEAASVEIVETDARGLAQRIRRTAVNGEVTEYKVEWVGNKRKLVRL